MFPKFIVFMGIILSIISSCSTSFPFLASNNNNNNNQAEQGLGSSGGGDNPIPGRIQDPKNLFWKLFTRGKSFFSQRRGDDSANFSNKNSSRRTDNRHQHRNRNHAFTQASSSDYDYDQPEHRIVNDHQHQDQSHYQHQGQDHDPSPKEDLTEHDHGYGWHKTSTSTSDYGQHMQLYTLLGGLSFASFLATAVILLTRPRPVATAGGRGNTTSILTKTKTTMANYLLNGNRKEDNVAYLKDQVDQSHHLFVKVPKLLHKLSKVLSPLWYVQEMEKREKVENLEKSEETGSDIDFVPLKVIKIPSVEENWRNLHF